MFSRRSQVAYRAASTDAGTQIDLLLASYEALAIAFRQAGDALEAKDIGARCEASNRALTLLGHAESWIDFFDEPSLADSLRAFYKWLRQETLISQTMPSRATFDALCSAVLEVRSTWQIKQEALVQARAQLQTTSPAIAGLPLRHEEQTGTAKWSA